MTLDSRGDLTPDWVDDVVVEEATRGRPTRALTRAEKRAAIALLRTRGHSVAETCALLDLSGTTYRTLARGPR